VSYSHQYDGRCSTPHLLQPSVQSSSSYFTRQRQLIASVSTVRYSSDKRSHGENIHDTNNSFRNGNNGEECYQLAIEALQKAAKAKKMHEEQLLQEQFHAMDRQRQRAQQRERKQNDPRLQRLRDVDEDSNQSNNATLKDRAAGVAVVRTIVKQSQPSTNNKKSHQSNTEQSQANDMEDEQHWQRMAKKHLEEAAFRYGDCLALVRLGNEALDLAKNEKNEDDSVRNLSLIDGERCREWMDESPVNLASILDLDAAAVAEGNANASYQLQLALLLYKEGGERGSAEGWYNLGHLLWEEDGTDAGVDGGIGDDGAHLSKTTKEKAMDAFHKAMQLDDADAIYFVASQYLSHGEIEESEEEESRDNDDKTLLWNTSNQYGSTFIDSLLQSTRDTLDLTTASAAEELPYLAMNELQKHGYQLLHIASHSHNHGPALHHLALLHVQHNNDDAKEFRNLLAKAVKTGNPDSLFLQGHCQYSGSDGYEQNFTAALQNFLEAAENGHVDAMVSAGAMLHNGIAIEEGDGTKTKKNVIVIGRDQQRAFELYQQAGELGSLEGWRNVVSCYATGQGVPKCLETATYIANTMLKDDTSIER